MRGVTVTSMPALDASAIHEVCGERIMLDADLADPFEVKTWVFNQAFKRNQERFPQAWAFELTQEECENLRSQNVISSGTWGGRRTLPWAFKVHGVALAASLLNTDQAKAVMQRFDG